MRSSNSTSCMIDESAPMVTLAMVADYLESIPVLFMPSRRRWSFRGFVALRTEMSKEWEIDDESEVLFICQSREAPKMLSHHSKSAFLIIHDGDSSPIWTSQFADRVMVIKKDRAYFYILFMMQEFFLRILFWSKRMRDVAAGVGSLQDMVDASADILENFVAVTDSSNVLLAHSKDNMPREKSIRDMVEMGFAPSQLVSKLEAGSSGSKQHDIRRTIGYSETGEPVDLYAFSIKHMGNSFGNCLIECNKVAMTEGMLDCVTLFLEWVGTLFERMWMVEMESRSPINMLFVNLISGQTMAPDVIRSKMSQLGLPESSQFKLVLIKTEGITSPKTLVSVMEDASHLNSGKSIPFRYAGDVLALLYTDEIVVGGCFSVVEVARDVESSICQPYSVYAGTSQVFKDIGELAMAYRQAVLAYEYRETLDMERSMLPDPPQKSSYAFEDAFVYYLLDQGINNPRFRDFIFSHSFLDKILEMDAENGTDDFRLLWMYLRCDCNVSLTAKMLFMHRNTVIYHIDKIKNMLQMDFSNKDTRDRSLMDFKIKFLIQSRHRQ